MRWKFSSYFFYLCAPSALAYKKCGEGFKTKERKKQKEKEVTKEGRNELPSRKKKKERTNKLPSRKEKKMKEGANKRTNEQLQAERVLWGAPKKKKKVSLSLKTWQEPNLHQVCLSVFMILFFDILSGCLSFWMCSLILFLSFSFYSLVPVCLSLCIYVIPCILLWLFRVLKHC